MTSSTGVACQKSLVFLVVPEAVLFGRLSDSFVVFVDSNGTICSLYTSELCLLACARYPSQLVQCTRQVSAVAFPPIDTYSVLAISMRKQAFLCSFSLVIRKYQEVVESLSQRIESSSSSAATSHFLSALSLTYLDTGH